jgi:class 3 adenylate cyclase
MGTEKENVVVLFANIADSERLYERMGDEVATDVIRTCLSLMHQVTQDQMGDVINAVRDKMDCLFWDAFSAVSAAKGMHEAVDTYILEETDGHIPVNLHIGIHAGSAQIEGDKLFGDAVNIVTKVTQTAKPREILMTETVFNDLDDTLKASARQSSTIAVKGGETPLKLYEYIWEDLDATLAMDRDKLSQLSRAQHISLELKTQDQIYEINHKTPRLYLGRQSQNEIVVPTKSASRFHAFIELRDGQIVFSDNSSNGTFFYPDESEPYHVKQQETYLEGSGTFGLGEDSGVDAPQAVAYRVKDTGD